jgi:translation elongation factor EF-Tu-like GTPase
MDSISYKSKLLIENVFPIEKWNEQVIITGKVEEGTFSVGDEVIIKRQDGTEATVVIKHFHMFSRGEMLKIQKGDNAGVSFIDIAKEDISIGDILIRNTITEQFEKND